jgi:hypothetical protein
MSPSRALSFVVVVVASLVAQQLFAAQRTFVASTGNDSNACSLAQPCRSFSAAIAQTSAGGDVIVLDSAGYGGVTITQSVNIIAPPGVYAGVTVMGASGIVVNAPGAIVSLRGLTLTGNAQHGIDYVAGAKLTVEDCTINGWGTGISAFGTTGRLIVRNTQVRNAGVFGTRLKGIAGSPLDAEFTGVVIDGSDSYGVNVLGAARVRFVDSAVVNGNDRAFYIDPDILFAANKTVVEIVRSLVANSSTGVDISAFSAAVTVEVAIRESDITRNNNDGVRMDVGNSSTVARLAISDTHIRYNGTDGLSLQNNAAGTNQAVLTRNVITRNADNGIFVGANVVLRTAGDNRVDSNGGTQVISNGTVTSFGGF